MSNHKPNTLVIILGDQLNLDSRVFENFDKKNDVVWMAEVEHESKKVWSHKARIVLFLSAMRHFKLELEKVGINVDYHHLDDHSTCKTLELQLEKSIKILNPSKIKVCLPGDYFVLQSIKKIAKKNNLPLEISPDNHFLSSPEDFKNFAKDRKELVMEFFYRRLRKKYGYLIDKEKPIGGKWNYDSKNRKSFGKSGPGDLSNFSGFLPDNITKEVINLINSEFQDHPGSLNNFNWPVTRKDAIKLLDFFIINKLKNFGTYQDAMWANEPFLYHSLLSSSLNLKLISPKEIIDKATVAYKNNLTTLENVESFIRQVLGWREYVRGIYWKFMPEYLSLNQMNAHKDLPNFYWTGDTDMNCMKNVINQTLEYGYAHHIQRLMVAGLYANLSEVKPEKIHEWFLAIYVDAVEWVEIPNTLGMSQFADGGIMSTKPYVASGNYINKMSNYCKSCKYKPSESTGDNACPFTTLYWNYLIKNQKKLSTNIRMMYQLKNLDRIDITKKEQIVKAASKILKNQQKKNK